MKDIVYPDGTGSAKVILVIETKSPRGSGRDGQVSRMVTEYWSLDGEKLAEVDPCKDIDLARIHSGGNASADVLSDLESYSVPCDKDLSIGV